MRSDGRNAGPAPPPARSRITALTRSPPCSVRSCSDCLVSAAPAAAGQKRGHGWPAHCRSTPELDQIRAQFSACMPYRVAAGVLEHLLPIDAGIDPETLRACTLKLGEELRDTAPAEPATAAAAITLTLDSTFIRSCETGQRHLEVRLGNVETSDGARQVSLRSPKPTPRSRR